LIVRRMTTVAVCRQRVPLLVTTLTIQLGVRTLQRPELSMVKLRPQPSGRSTGVAHYTIRRKAGTRMIRILSTVVLVQMTVHAVGRQPGILAAGMAVCAIGRLVLAQERKVSVVELSSLPGSGSVSMATGAIGRESGVGMRRILCGIEVAQVAIHTVGRQPGELAADVTVGAVRRLVLTLEQKAGVLELGSLPGRGCVAVAGRAIGRETRIEVIRFLSVVVIVHVAVGAVGGQTRILTAGMAVGTIG